ncbi:ABC transporter permease [Aerococcus sp. UMB7834]|uniref:ABC transporter permease n=1 Tax=Aerococcus sp. UMB7834 TaxID=3046342 RepID=UPI00254DFF9D|nr:ABC transporter permease [Aerococcus sp. UMB7834]MDK6805786.1 ABC transporter permease [Aerococcus sp. UMB7834]
MLRQSQILLKLRLKIYQTNFQYLIAVLAPYLFVLIYQMIFDSDQLSGDYQLFMILPLLYSITLGQMITPVISEEKEKDNLKELQLSNVSGVAYLFSSLFFPVLLTLLGLILIPLFLGVPYSVNYFIVSILTGIILSLLYLIISLACRSVNEAQAIAIILILIIMLFPMVSAINETIADFTHFTFLSLFTSYFMEEFNQIWQTSSFWISLVWLLALLAISHFFYKRVVKV